MEPQSRPPPSARFSRWTPASEELEHPLAALDGAELAGGRLRVMLGRRSRFGARYFALLFVGADGAVSGEPVLSGLHQSGPLPSYNWVEVAETNERVRLPGAGDVEISAEGLETLLRLLLDVLPAGGHIMVEYDSRQRAETAQALAHGVPAIATPLGELLFRIGCGAHFKDWQIAEGGSEGPRKLQAYKPASADDARRWRQRAGQELRHFLDQPLQASAPARVARERAARLLNLLD